MRIPRKPREANFPTNAVEVTQGPVRRGRRSAVLTLVPTAWITWTIWWNFWIPTRQVGRVGQLLVMAGNVCVFHEMQQKSFKKNKHYIK